MADALRVVHLASDDAWGGAERVLSVLIPEQARETALRVEAVLLNDGALAASLRRDGVSVSVVPETEQPFRALLRKLRGALSDADVIHAHRYKEIALAALIRRSHQKLVATVHGLQPWGQIRASDGAIVWTALWLARARGCRFAAVSRELQERLQRGLADRGVLRIPNPIVPANPGPAADLRERFGWEKTRRLVGFAGRLEPVKGPDLLLAAARLLPADASVVFIGAGSLEAGLRASCADGLASRVGFVGEVPDARPYLGQLDVLALPSRHEGLPMVVLEAAQASLPVAAFNVGGVPEVLTDADATRLVEPGDIPGLARAIDSLLCSSTARSAASDWGRQLSSECSLESVSARYTELYSGA